MYICVCVCVYSRYVYVCVCAHVCACLYVCDSLQSMCVCVAVCVCLQRPEEAGIPRNWCYRLLRAIRCECWLLDLGPLEEQQVPSAAALTLFAALAEP